LYSLPLISRSWILNYLRGSLPFAVFAVIGVANAQVTFNNVAASYTLNPGATTRNWIVSSNGAAMTIDFTQNAPPFKVGDGTGFSTGTSAITYDVTATNAISSIDLLLQGDVELFGRIQVNESVSNINGSLGSLAAVILGSSHQGGADGAFTRTYHLDFSQAVTSFSVTQTLAIDISGQELPSPSIAVVGTVEQNLSVPEPGSFAIVGLGILALLRKRKR
jgi:hypothetical protein